MLTEVGVEEWPFIAATIEPAISSPSLAQVRDGLAVHHMQAWRPEKNHGLAGYVVTKTATIGDTAETAMWLLYAAGKVFPPVRKNIIALVRELEEQARAWGCNETRITGGRVAQWRHVLRDYEPIGAGLRKVLHG